MVIVLHLELVALVEVPEVDRQHRLAVVVLQLVDSIVLLPELVAFVHLEQPVAEIVVVVAVVLVVVAAVDQDALQEKEINYNLYILSFKSNK